MRNHLLTVLGCSSSLTLALFTTNAASANTDTPTYQEYTFTAPGISSQEIVEVEATSPQEDEWFDCSCGGENTNLNFDDRLGDLAISRYGCDCAGCRYMTSKLVEVGN